MASLTDFIRRIWCAILRGLGLAGPEDVVVVEDSADDNGYLTGKAERNPGAVRATSKEDMVDGVLGELGPCDCIRRLTIIGHGSPGNISTGDGQGWETCKHVNGNRDEWEEPLSRLQGRFCAGATIELVGCNTGAGEAGADKLQELADFLGATVEAPTGKTYGDCSEEEGSTHVVARPGDRRPTPVESPSDEEKKEKDQPEKGDEEMPFDPETIDSIGIHPAQTGREGLEEPEDAAVVIDDAERIVEFLAGIDFSRPIDGHGLGADYNAYVLVRAEGTVSDYVICADFDYFLERDDWEHMYEIGWNLKQELRELMEEART